jgi:hypothetical protein
MTNARASSSHLLDLLRREHGSLADFLVALATFDERRLWMQLGYASLFQYLHRELGMSKGAAHYRKTAAELIQRVPEVAETLRSGQLCVTSIVELAKVLTHENREEVLPRFFHCSRQEAKAVSVELRPMEAAPHRTVVTALSALAPEVARVVASEVAPSVLPPAGRLTAPPLAAPNSSPERVTSVQPGELRSMASSPPALQQAQPAPPRSTAEPLTADLRRLHVTVSKRFMEKLEAARDALSHSHRGADVEAILEAGLDLVVERAAKRKGIVAKPRTGRKAPGPCSPPLRSSAEGEGDRTAPPRPESRRDGEGGRAIAAEVRREVWLRDDGRCAWRLENGERCGSTHRLQFDHVEAVAHGGPPTVGNVRLLCAPHNLLAARRVFGNAFMDRFAPGRPRGAAGVMGAKP